MASHRVGLPQAKRISVSNYVARCLLLPGAVVTGSKSQLFDRQKVIMATDRPTSASAAAETVGALLVNVLARLGE
jgi:hypothetical protein